MRLAVIVAIVMLVPAYTAPQDTVPPSKSTKPPDKGDDVVVAGCVRGPVLESTETRKADGTGATAAAIHYRMTGKKDVLKPLREDHEGHLEEISGELKSKLPDGNLMKGKQIGNTRIFIGGASPRPGSIQEMTPHLPVLEVKSVRHVADRCGV